MLKALNDIRYSTLFLSLTILRDSSWRLTQVDNKFHFRRPTIKLQICTSRSVLCITNVAFVDCTDDLSLLSDRLKSKGFDGCQNSSKEYFKQRSFSTPTRDVWISVAHWHRPGLLNLLCVAGSFGKIWPACEQHDVFPYYGTNLSGDHGGTLRYKSEGRWFDSRWCHWNFSLT
jgi:hypothetical protein